MQTIRKPSVLVCVTGQYDCDRLIRAGHAIAAEKGCELRVLCVRTPMRDVSALSNEIEYLYRTAKDLGADMTVAFNSNAPRCAADFAQKIHARHFVTGMPDDRPNGFVLTLHERMPHLPITTVTKDNEYLVYAPVSTAKSLA